MTIRPAAGVWCCEILASFGFKFVIACFPSSSVVTFRFVTNGLRPLLKLSMQSVALLIVRIIRMIVMMANVVSDFRAGRYGLSLLG